MGSRKLYVALADALARTRPTGPNATDLRTGLLPESRTQWECDRAAIAGVLAEDNERFDWVRFYTATEQEVNG